MARERELITKLRSWLRRLHGSDDTTAMRKAFDTYDRDGDGELAPNELGAVLADAGVGNKLTRGAWVKGILSRLDRDGRGALSWDDFQAAINGAPA